MKLNAQSPLLVLLYSLILIFQFSCSKDSDLLADYVIADAQEAILIDDIFVVSLNGSTVLDVLANDNYDVHDNVTITEISQPSNGEATINEDNTITYTPETTTEESTTEETATEETEDTFTYTTEVVNVDESVITETGNVTVTISEDRAPITGNNVYYVTTTGKSNNSGATETTAWNIQHAFSTAVAGDVVYIKAGLYSDFNISQSRNGTSANPIQFIGYKNTPEDIDPDAQQDYTLGTQTIKVLSSFVYGDNVDSTAMPLLQETRLGSNGAGTAIKILGAYVELSNIQIKYYGASLFVDTTASFGVFKNIITSDIGNQADDSYIGKSIYNKANNNTFKNIYVENSGAEAFKIQGDYGTYDAITIVADNTTNPTDYYFLHTKGNNNQSTNIYVRKVGSLAHYGHGIVFKTPDECYNNTVTDFIVDNTSLELQFPGVHNNTIKNGYVVKQSNTSSDNAGGLVLSNGTYDNTYDNIFLKDCEISFQDWTDGLAGDVADSGDGNVFNQITVLARDYAPIEFHYYGNGNYDSSADDNTFYNCTFYSADYMFTNSRANSNTQFINCVWSDMAAFSIKRSTSPGYSIDASYTKCNFSNSGFTPPAGTNITTFDPQFLDVNNYNLSPQNSALLSQGVATPFLPAGNDLGAVQD